MQKHWLWVCVLGFGIIVLAGPVLSAFPTTAHSFSPGYGAPIYAFEMANTIADLTAVFGPEDDALRQQRIMQMDDGNRWDFAFMATYGLFMCSFFYSVWITTAQRVWLCFAGVGLLAGCADAIENLILLNLTSNLEQAPFIEWLAFPVWTKFLSIMTCIAAAGGYLCAQKRLLWKALGASAMFGALAIFMAFLAPATYGKFIATGTTVGWVAMLLFASSHVLLNKERT